MYLLELELRSQIELLAIDKHLSLLVPCVVALQAKCHANFVKYLKTQAGAVLEHLEGGLFSFVEVSIFVLQFIFFWYFQLGSEILLCPTIIL